MVDPQPLVVTANDVAVRIGMGGALAPAQVAVIESAIRDVQADVEAYLGAPIAPRTVAHASRFWLDPQEMREHWVPLITWDVTEQTAEEVVYSITFGYDVLNDVSMEPVRRYIRYQAAQQPQVRTVWVDAVGQEKSRRVKTASVDGQSVGYDYVTPTGELLPFTTSLGKAATESGIVTPKLADLDYWRIAGRRAFQRRGPGSDPWAQFGYTYYGGSGFAGGYGGGYNGYGNWAQF